MSEKNTPTEPVMIATTIMRLQYLLHRYGNKPLVYASDEEGNGYSYVYFDATPGRFDGSEFDGEAPKTEVNAICIN
jgi:hypothetical protein